MPSDRQIEGELTIYSRIKSTEQAKEVLTVPYASKQPKQMKPGEHVAEQQLLDYVLN
ncbi:MAG: hypothetical protein HC853_16260 [Anaerolineae bacterium]|nr:hypothetical protein [Anaerolineae bacterium]